MSRILRLAVAFALWEVFWGYVYFTAPRPDERMVTILAQVMGIVFPICMALMWWLAFLIMRSARRS